VPLDEALTTYQRTKRREEAFLAIFLFVVAVGLMITAGLGILVIHNQGRILHANRELLVTQTSAIQGDLARAQQQVTADNQLLLSFNAQRNSYLQEINLLEQQVRNLGGQPTLVPLTPPTTKGP